MILRYRS